MAQFVLPIMSLIIFAAMPAGKKLFIITTLSFSIVQICGRQLWFFGKKMSEKLENFGSKAAGFAESEPKSTELEGQNSDNIQNPQETEAKA